MTSKEDDRRTVRMPSRLWKKINSHAKNSNQTASGWLRSAAKQQIEKNERRAKIKKLQRTKPR